VVIIGLLFINHINYLFFVQKFSQKIIQKSKGDCSPKPSKIQCSDLTTYDCSHIINSVAERETKISEKGTESSQSDILGFHVRQKLLISPLGYNWNLCILKLFHHSVPGSRCCCECWFFTFDQFHLKMKLFKKKTNNRTLAFIKPKFQCLNDNVFGFGSCLHGKVERFENN